MRRIMCDLTLAAAMLFSSSVSAADLELQRGRNRRMAAAAPGGKIPRSQAPRDRTASFTAGSCRWSGKAAGAGGTTNGSGSAENLRRIIPPPAGA